MFAQANYDLGIGRGPTDEEIVVASAKLINFIDLAGHEK